jgi:hypothetical protein
VETEVFQSAESLSQEQASKVEDRVFEDIHDTADEIRSRAISIREAAFRRDDIYLRIYRVEFIQQARLLAGLINDLAPLEGEKAEAGRG